MWPYEYLVGIPASLWRLPVVLQETSMDLASELARPLIPEGAGLTIIAGVPSWKMLLKSK
jgi:hypothetical protein